MKTRTLVVAFGLAAISGIASAETGVSINQSGNVANVYGRSGVPPMHFAGAAVTRTAEEVVPGPTTHEGPTAIAIGNGNQDVTNVYGRS
jgi:hypothetical protein